MKKPFVPYKLPLTKEVDITKFVNELIEANKLVGIYNTLLSESKISKALLLKPITLQEAIQSTKIEGTQITLDEMLEFNAGETTQTSDIIEVLNYSEALVRGEYLLKTLPISSRLMKEMHKILLGGNVRGSSRAPGEFRRIQNFIGPQGCTIENASFIPPEPQLIEEYLSDLEKYINDPKDELNDLARIAIIHAQFETIHPFLDGNGRIGRMLIPLYLYNKSIIDAPNFFISESLEKDKFRYYKLLNDTREKGNWNEWIKFFLQSIIVQSKKNITLIKSIDNLYNITLGKCQELISNNRIINIIDVMFRFPVFTKNKILDEVEIASSTLSNYLRILEENNIIYSDGKPRNRRYYCYELINLLR